MSFLKKMFGKKDPVEAMRQSHARQDWAGVLSCARNLEREALDETAHAEVVAWENEAGDALAMINLDEGAWAQQSGNLRRAREDYMLAREQARSTELKKRAEQALAALERGELPAATPAPDATAATHASCNSCAPTPVMTAPTDDLDLDQDSRMELLLATLPPDLAERYLAAGAAFKKAWLASQDGDERQALRLLNDVPEAERNALFLLERGSLMARGGQLKKARQDFQAALTAEPNLFLAFDALVEVLIATGRIDDLEKALKENIAANRFGGYCWGRLAELHAQRKELEPALAAGLKSLEEGTTDPGLIILCAQLLERAERFDEAEGLLMRLSGKGCGGGAHPMLAEFWLRREQNLNKALESFKGALRQERDNPRWALRIAQVYLAKGWKKEAAEQIERLMQQGGLHDPIRAEVKAMADQLQKS